MNKIKHADGEKLNRLVFTAGLAAVLFMALPYILLGQDSVFVYHDQLDGELIAYILQAKHLFGGDTLPEFMGGVYKTALTVPAPAALLIFKAMSPFAALVVMQLFGSIIGYVGMYGLVKYATGRSIIAAAVGVIYGYLPFLPVYGLSQYGIPMLIWTLLYAAKKKTKDAVIPAIIYGVVYALNSSLVLVGFAVLGSMAVWMLILLINRQKGTCRIMAVVWLCMLIVYIVENISLIMQTLGISDTYVSHKTEYTLLADTYVGGFVSAFINGGEHSGDFHRYFTWLILLEAVCCLLPYVRARIKNMRILKVMYICVAVNACFALITALWNGELGVMLRSNFGALGAFQMDRFLWMSPCLWYLAFACSLALLIEAGAAAFLPVAVMLAVCGGRVLLGSSLKPNLQKMINPEYGAISFNDYYAVGVLDKVDEFITELTGRQKEEYRVVSLGIDPAAALYHGFYCLDGYSNNYSLEYKHRFRQIIASELDKSDYLSEYFDGWGNRCYLFSAECPGYYTIEKGGFYFQEYSIDTDALRSMGGEYIISAAYIANAQECGLTLLSEEPFETQESYYRIYLYGLQ
ncbi:MAG: DUF6044 family protein [Lachnospiraceae bacterium]|nr:DUF6044 family protein [Lachnospiraceae bacterium]